MSYLDSRYVGMYPSAYRKNDIDKTACLHTEENLTTLKMLSKQFYSFSYIDGEDLILSIFGYVFRLYSVIDSGTTPTQDFISALSLDGTDNTVYASIKLKDSQDYGTGNDYGRILIPNTDDSTSVNILDSQIENDPSDNPVYIFKGLKFSQHSTKPVDTDTYKYIPIMSKENDAWVIKLQPLKLSTTEIANGDLSNNSIDKYFATKNLTVSNAGNGQATIDNATITNANINSATIDYVVINDGTITVDDIHSTEGTIDTFSSTDGSINTLKIPNSSDTTGTMTDIKTIFASSLGISNTTSSSIPTYLYLYDKKGNTLSTVNLVSTQKAYKDGDGNFIKSTYGSKLSADGSSSASYLKLVSKNDTILASLNLKYLGILPFATDSTSSSEGYTGSIPIYTYGPSSEKEKTFVTKIVVYIKYNNGGNYSNTITSYEIPSTMFSTSYNFGNYRRGPAGGSDAGIKFNISNGSSVILLNITNNSNAIYLRSDIYAIYDYTAS